MGSKPSLMLRSHQPRSHPDLNLGLYRERVGLVISAPTRSYHVLMSILAIGLIVEKVLTAKFFFPINKIGHDCLDYRDHRIRSYDIVTKRNKTYLIVFQIVLIGVEVGQEKQHDLLRCPPISYDLLRSKTHDRVRLVTTGHA